MNKKFAVAWLIVFVAWMCGSFLVHAILLQDSYGSTPALFRTPEDSQRYFPYMLLGHVIMAGALVWIYQRGREPKPWVAQGARFGVAIALLHIVPMYLIYYAVQPLHGNTVVRQIVFDGALVILLGMLVAFLYRDAPSA